MSVDGYSKGIAGGSIMTKGKDRRAVVLLVDDEEVFLEFTAKNLARRGFKVLKASRGKEALSIVRKHEIDVAVLDVKMPDIDGHRLFYIIKDEYPGIQIIMLTGHGNLNKAFELGKKGVFEYLGKPCKIGELSDCICRALEESSEESVSDKDEIGGPEYVALVRVLLVDDDGDLLESTSKALSQRGLDVCTAMDGGGPRAFHRELRVPGVEVAYGATPWLERP